MKLADVILQWLERYDLCLWAILFVLRARKEFKYYQLHQQIIIFWGLWWVCGLPKLLYLGHYFSTYFHIRKLELDLIFGKDYVEFKSELYTWLGFRIVNSLIIKLKLTELI